MMLFTKDHIKWKRNDRKQLKSLTLVYIEALYRIRYIDAACPLPLKGLITMFNFRNRYEFHIQYNTYIMYVIFIIIINMTYIHIQTENTIVIVISRLLILIYLINTQYISAWCSEFVYLCVILPPVSQCFQLQSETWNHHYFSKSTV